MSDISKIRVNGSDYTIKDAEGRTLIATKAPIASPTFTGTPLAPTADSNADNTQIANTAWVNDRIDAAIATSDAMIFKGTIGKEGATITTKTLPNSTAKTGWTYKAVEAGDYTVGTGTGTGTTTVKCEVGDMIIALSNGSSSTYATWVVVQANIDGAVTGPASATANHIATFDGTSGKIIKDSGYTIQTSVPQNAVFTDQSVTAVGNHYTPTGTTTKSASGATGTSGTTVQVVTGVTMDAKGHVTAVTSGAATDTLNTVGATDSSTQTIYAVGVLESGRGQANAPSYTDRYVTFSDGHIDCDGANIEGDTVIGTTAINRALTVNGTIASTGAITQNGTAVSLSGHTHSTSIAASTGTSQLAMSASTKYAITAGGTSYIFTTPADTWRGIQDNLTSSTNTTESLSAKQGYLLANGSARDSTKVPTTRKVNGHALSADITITAADVGAVTTDTKDTVGATSASTRKYYPVGILEDDKGSAYAQSYYDPEFYVTDGYLNASKLTATTDLVVGRDASIAGALAVTGAITQNGTAVSLSGHTHSTSIATSTGTSQITLSANTKYAITAGGTSYIFTTPTDTNTWRGIQDNLTSSTNTTESLSAKQGYLLANGSARDSTKVPTTRKVNGHALSADITITAADVGAVTTDTKDTVGATDASTRKIYVVGVLEDGKGSTYAQSHIDQSATFTDGVLDCDGANIEGNTTIGTASVNRTLTVNGTIASTGAITQGGTAVTLATHRHTFSGDTITASVTFSNKSGATTFLTPTTSTAGTLPTWSASVSSETLSFSFSGGNFPVYSSQGVATTLSGSTTFTVDGDVTGQYYPS